MRVKVFFFGALRESLGSEISLDLPTGSSASVLLQIIRNAPEPLLRSCAVAVNQQYVNLEHVLRDGDEVALLPPVSGGTGPLVQLVREPIVTAEVLSGFSQDADGAVVTFEGTVRDNTRGRRTLYLEYEAYEDMALQQMRELALGAVRDHGIRDALLVHRLGRIEIGEVSVLIAVASAHRAQAFEACRWLIDTLKQTVPIWKKEHFEDGSVWAQGEPFPQVVTQ
jgi:molybdopterin synthase catalytic subunit